MRGTKPDFLYAFFIIAILLCNKIRKEDIKMFDSTVQSPGKCLIGAKVKACKNV